MALSSHDRQVLASIEHDLSSQDPELADLFNTAGSGWWWLHWLPVPLRHLGWLAVGLLVLIIVHVGAAEVSPLVSALLTGALIITWLTATARATRGRTWGPQPRSLRRPTSGNGAAGRRAATTEGDRDGPDDGFCPA